MKGKLLLVGGDSEIGAATARHLRAIGAPVMATTRRPERVAPDRPYLDLASPLSNWEPPAETRAACLFAAIARLQDCARDPAGSAFLNVEQTLALAERLLARGIYVLFLSTNQVFDGSAPCMPPDAPTCPVSTYGKQKARAEVALRERMGQGASVGILRLTKVVSPGMPLLRQWTKALSAREPVRAFSDTMMAPVPAALAAAAVARLMDAAVPGIFQLSGPCDVSYAAVAIHLAHRVGTSPELITSIAARTASMPEGATPRHTTLDSTALRERFGIVAPEPWHVIDGAVKMSLA